MPKRDDMPEFIEKYINPFTDYGFKRLFGEEPNKELLLDFLNELLKNEQGKIIGLTYLKSDRLGNSEDGRKAVFDLYCENEDGEKFIVELQKTKQKFFKDRTVYYSTFPIREQAQRGSDWNFELKAVYTIAILDFVFDSEMDELDKFRYDVKLTDIETCKIFYDKLTFIYLEMPKFNKPVELLESRFDKWMYVIRNLNKLNRVPDELRENIFERLFEVAEIAKFSKEEAEAYEESLKSYRDLQNSLDMAREEAIDKRNIEIVQNSLNAGLSIEMIASITGLSSKDIERIKNER
ncbi:Rpn family recombination-promoting nuclease/putative transposase [Tunicatimonas pelagia]|uniref:Rpn family recombination-promoting nuclease/putative transposase n=1 Tax=Tunicatimonas pelagia TaxID=931531 RepID=UPI002665DE4E|nr:Rpn family recombination-promoting nuclease/putative transposase [Tunicatimonas pelagia]WKN43318.1 Rpn family recombination-promoting nuclease/putative transposase [Tunicatimonas pelagia]